MPLSFREEIPRQPPAFVRGDRRGNVYWLSGSDLVARPILPNGKLGEALPHESSKLSNGPPLRMVLSRNGDWLVLAPPEVRLLRQGKQEVLPALEWLPIDIGFLRDDPIVNTNGVRLTRPPQGGLREDPPLIVRFTGKTWEPFLREPIPSKLEAFDPRVHELRSLHLVGDSRGTLWLANEYMYRVRRFSSAGRLLLELTLGPQKVDPRSDAQKVQRSFEKSTQERLRQAGGQAVVQASTSRRVLLAVTEGRDGHLYFLVSEPSVKGGLALDRFDSALLRMERTPILLQAEGYLSMASGKDGLYFAAYNAKAGPWKLGWEEIEAAHWTSLKNLQIDRQVPLPAEDAPEKP